MKTRLTLRPGQKGTKRLLEEHGERLVCVRYRYDSLRNLRVKTVELVVDERPWVYCKPLSPARRNPSVLVAIAPQDLQLRREVRSSGGTWRPEHSAWEMKLREAQRLGVDGLVVRTLRRASPCIQPAGASRAREHLASYARHYSTASTTIPSTQ